MLNNFTCKNFKNFNDLITIKFDSKNIILGPNGCGKTNLGLALFDITYNLNDRVKNINKYHPYSNIYNDNNIVSFTYEFKFGNSLVIYKYNKSDLNLLINESLIINNIEVINFDFINNKGFCKLKGTKDINISNKDYLSNNTISRVKYIKNSALLDYNDPINKVFLDFTNFVSKMVLINHDFDNISINDDIKNNYSLEIIRMGKLNDFNNFLKDFNINYNLVEYGSIEKDIYCLINNKYYLFNSIMSNGIKELGLFYYYFQIIKKASFVYYDDFGTFLNINNLIKVNKFLDNIEKLEIVLTTNENFIDSCNNNYKSFKILNNEIKSQRNSVDN